MKKLILLSLTATLIFSSVSVFVCGDGQDSSSRSAQSAVVEGSDTSSSDVDSSSER